MCSTSPSLFSTACLSSEHCGHCLTLDAEVYTGSVVERQLVFMILRKHVLYQRCQTASTCLVSLNSSSANSFGHTLLPVV